ncbi:MAG: phosphoribosylamine--glycine ligase [Acidobacteria bacterium]|nr:MAG: phosphoribosylamine--glycine ligase [Acidobacteriota bacterium]
MRVLVIGSGAREHAIVHALRRSPEVSEVFAAPGNPGIAQAADILPLAVDDIPSLAEAAADLRIDLTVVGPELPLALGIGDEFSKRGLRLFGPTSAAAQLESSKVFAKDFCRRHNIPTPQAICAVTEDQVREAVKEFGFPVVLKADGLAAGKGVLIPSSQEELEEALEIFFTRRSFGEAGSKVLVEEFVVGTEVSFMAISDGVKALPLATSRDYKRIGEGDAGPNTGGMGAHSPALGLPRGLGRTIMDTVITPVIQGMAAEGREYRGVLYAGLMLGDDGPTVLEFNCRFGDPETQAVLLRLEGSFASLVKSAADGQLAPGGLSWRREVVACVVAAAHGYPALPRKGDDITGIEEAMALPAVTVYHAGTRLEGDRLVTSGGRVLSVCGRGPDLESALETAYRGLGVIHFEGLTFRKDIGADTLAQQERE